MRRLDASGRRAQAAPDPAPNRPRLAPRHTARRVITHCNSGSLQHSRNSRQIFFDFFLKNRLQPVYTVVVYIQITILLSATPQAMRQNRGERKMTDKQHINRRYARARAHAETYTVGDMKKAARRGLLSQWLACKEAAEAKAERLYART